MSLVFSVFRFLIMCFISPSVSKVTIPPNFVELIMPTEAVVSKLFDSQYYRNEAKWAAGQKMKANINDMKAKGLITPSGEMEGNPMSGKNVEYMSAPNSGNVKSLSSDGGEESDLDLTIENLFKSTMKATNKKAKDTEKSEEKFQKFLVDEKYGITIPNDVTVDYVGTDFGSIMEFIEIVTKSRKEYLTKKQLYDSEEFMPKFPHEKKQYYVMKEKLFDTDELTKPSVEKIDKKRTLSLLERVNKVTRATRVKKRATFKRKMFSTQHAEGSEVEDEEEITEQYYENIVPQDNAEVWREANNPKNIEGLVEKFMKDQEQELKNNVKRLTKKTETPTHTFDFANTSALLITGNKRFGEKTEKATEDIFAFLDISVPQITAKPTVKSLYEHVILTKKYIYPPSTTTKKRKATKSKKTKKSKKITKTSKSFPTSNTSTKSSNLIKSIPPTSLLNKTISQSNIYSIICPSTEYISPFPISKAVHNTTLANKGKSTLLRMNSRVKSKFNLSSISMTTPSMKKTKEVATVTYIKLIRKEKKIKRVFPTFKKVLVKTMGIRKFSTKMK